MVVLLTVAAVICVIAIVLCGFVVNEDASAAYRAYCVGVVASVALVFVVLRIQVEVGEQSCAGSCLTNRAVQKGSP